MRQLSLLPILMLAACSSSESAESDPVDTGPVPRYHYVFDSMTLPMSASDAELYGLDLDADGTFDNQLGNILSAMVQAAGSGALDVQGMADELIANGDVLLLGDLGTLDFTNASGASFATMTGANSNPAPCTDVSKPESCRQHLAGTGAFDVAAPPLPALQGAIASGVYAGGPGQLTVQLPLFGTVVDVVLDAARVELTGASATGIESGILAGGISEPETTLLPGMQQAFALLVTRDCTGGAPPSCGCMADSTGQMLLGLFDEDADCAIDLTEFQNNSLIETLLRPDLTVDGKALLSVGLGVSAVKAEFTVVGE